jgi:tryptophan synthase alpha chain
MSRIAAMFRRLAEKEGKALIPYITAGDPDLETTEALIMEMAARGADLIELGVPFSDPMADGPIIQRAAERALAAGTKLKDILSMVAGVRRNTEVPIILFSYYNPLLQYGLAKLVADAHSAGTDGMLVTDLVPEEAEPLLAQLKAREMDMIFLLAPTSSPARIAKVAKLATGFIYAVSRTGITGMQDQLSTTILPLLKSIATVSRLPLAVGFGISHPEHVQAVWQYAAAAVVGSRIVAEIADCKGKDETIRRVGNLISALRGS